MIISNLQRLGAGQFAELYRGKDDLDRDVAVKFVRPSMGGKEFAMNQAKALARAGAHTNVVSVYGFEHLLDPTTNSTSPAIVMEYVHGDTLKEVFKKPKLSPADCWRIGAGILDGLEHIHRQGLQHGDLHAENILVGPAQVKIIDILYYDSLSIVSTQRKEDRISGDLRSLRSILRQMLQNTEVPPEVPGAFDQQLGAGSSLNDIRIAFQESLGIQINPNSNGRPVDVVARVKTYLSESRFSIQLSDLVRRELSEVTQAFSSPKFDVAGPVPDSNSITARLADSERVMSRLLPMVATIALWGTPEQLRLSTEAIKRLGAFRSKSGTSYNAWTGMKRYPALLLLYGAGICCMADQRLHNLRQLLELQIEDDGELLPVTRSLHPARVLLHPAMKTLPDLDHKIAPQSIYLAQRLRAPLEELVFDEGEYARAFDQFEYLQALVAADQEGMPYAGSFSWKLSSHTLNRAESDQARLITIEADLLRAGFFSGKPDRLTNARQEVETSLANVRFM